MLDDIISKDENGQRLADAEVSDAMHVLHSAGILMDMCY